MFPDTNTAWSIFASILVAATVAGIAWWRRGKVDRDREHAGWDAILGKAAVLDRAGREIEEEEPGLVSVTRENADRLTKVEKAFIELKDLVTAQDTLSKRVDNVVTRVDGHDDAIASIIANTFERGAEAALTAVEKQQSDTIDVDPDE